MNIIDALKSGKPYRRAIWQDEWCWRYPVDVGPRACISEAREDMLAEDWEVKD